MQISPHNSFRAAPFVKCYALKIKEKERRSPLENIINEQPAAVK